MQRIDSLQEKHSLALQAEIKEKIKQHNSISFSQYMQMALYQPGLGYYSSGTHKFGTGGDFVTSPELGSLFAQCMADQFSDILIDLKSPCILELGAGTGQFCFDCLSELNAQNKLPKNYYILEVSADLKHRQQQKIATLPDSIQSLVSWVDEPPKQGFNGIIFANEVLDALAVEVFKFENNQFMQMRVEYNESYCVQWQHFEQKTNNHLINKNLNLEEGYISEFSPLLEQWLKSITYNLKQGVVIFVDYGYDRQTYYHPQRNQGTLVCHFNHQANYDYFENIGTQDITAFVDFTAVAEAADYCELSVEGYTTQAHFLLSLGIQEKLGEPDGDYATYYKNTTEMKKLTLPNEMGDKFKVIALSKNFETEIKGFEFANQLHQL